MQRKRTHGKYKGGYYYDAVYVFWSFRTWVHQTKMDVIGNNIANVNTTGFKSLVLPLMKY